MVALTDTMILVVKIAFIFFFFGFCVFIHEFGHLLVAMWRKLHIERFSIGFGKPIFKWKKNNIEYVLSWLPFGGYVALPQLDPSDQAKTSDGEPLPQVRPIDRILTAFAGPLFNVIFGFMLACIIWQVGIEGPPPANSFVVGEVPETYQDAAAQSYLNPEYAAGLRAGDRVVAVNGKSFVKGWHEAAEMIVYSPEGLVDLTVIRADRSITISYHLVPNPDFEGLGYPFMSPLLPARISMVVKDSPAMTAGLKSGDIVEKFNDEKVMNPDHLVTLIQDTGMTPFALTVRRATQEVEIHGIVANKREIETQSKYFIGIHIEADSGQRVLYYPTPWQQFIDVVDRTTNTIDRLIDKDNPIEAKHMSGPVGIFHMLYVIVSKTGFMAALNLIIIINFSLAFINLLPLPILDGGHIAMGVFEMIIKRRIPSKITIALSYAFSILIIGFMLYVTFYDAKRVGKYIHPGKKAPEIKAIKESPPSDVSEENKP